MASKNSTLSHQNVEIMHRMLKEKFYLENEAVRLHKVLSRKTSRIIKLCTPHPKTKFHALKKGRLIAIIIKNYMGWLWWLYLSHLLTGVYVLILDFRRLLA